MLGTQDAVRVAEAAFSQSLRTAREQNVLSWELRTATSLACLWRSEHRAREARDLLAPVYARFVEGFGTPDLLRAAAVLRALDHLASDGLAIPSDGRASLAPRRTARREDRARRADRAPKRGLGS